MYNEKDGLQEEFFKEMWYSAFYINALLKSKFKTDFKLVYYKKERPESKKFLVLFGRYNY